MKWRTVGSKDDDGPEDKPTLEAVLDHYGVQHSTTRRSQMVRCLFHHDATPSMSIDLARQVFNCHSCGEGGDSYALLMKREELTFGGAREFAATVGLATGSAGGSDDSVRASSITGSRRVPGRKGDRPSTRVYSPSWRRK